MERIDGKSPAGIRTQRSCRTAAAFTLIEVLVVIAVIALLAAILLPTLDLAFEHAYATMCRRNLKCLAQAMHGNNPESGLTVPSPAQGAWIGAAVEYGSEDILICKKDDERERCEVDLSKVHIVQYNHNHQWEAVSVQVLLDWMNGETVAVDPGAQIWVMSGRASSCGIHSFNTLWEDIPSRRPNLCARWLPDPATLKDNQYIMLVYDDCGIKLTIEDRVLIESIDGEKDGVHRPNSSSYYCNSSHYLVQGDITLMDDSKSDPEEGMPGVKQLMHLTGANYVNIVDPPVMLGGGKTSYGMNGLIEPRKFGMQQLMLMDANRPELEVGRPNWQKHIKARHLGRVNVVDVSGCVRIMSPGELQYEYLLLEDQGSQSTSLWNRHACPGLRD